MNFIPSNADIINLNRGDTLNAPLFINIGTFTNPIRYRLLPTDKLYFGIMEPNQCWENSIVRQVYTSESGKTKDGDIIIQLTPEDTEFLLPGTYYYMIKLLTTKEVIYYSYLETEDESYNPLKTYYIIDKFGNYQQFKGNEFDPTTIYYEREETTEQQEQVHTIVPKTLFYIL